VILLLVGVSTLINGEGLTWANWDEQQVCQPLTYDQPASESEIIDIVLDAAARGVHVKVVGAGHSFSAIALTNGRMISLDRYDAVVALDRENRQVTVQAGMRLHVLNEYLQSVGLALTNLGAISLQSAAGVTATSTHGTGNTGSMATTITAFTLIIANGTVMSVTPSTYPDVFAAGRVSLGALGILSTITFQCVDAFKLQRVLIPYHLNDLVALLPSLLTQYERLQWFWEPYTDNAMLLLRVPTDAPITGCWAEHSSTTEKHNYPQRMPSIPVPPNATSCVDWSYKAMTGPRDSPSLYTEMEYFVPVSDGPAAVADYRDFQESVASKHNRSVHLFTGVRYVKADDIWLSPMYGQDIAVISFIVRGTPRATGSPAEFSMYAHGLAQVAAKYGGRPHWGKQNYATAADLAPLYPRWNDFIALRARLDPNGVFLNDYLLRVLGS